jgi:2,3-dihydroxybenzoate decarboxylase
MQRPLSVPIRGSMLFSSNANLIDFSGILWDKRSLYLLEEIMENDRRSFLKYALAGYAAAKITAINAAAQNVPPYAKGAQKPAKVDYKRIATEEAWGPSEMFKMYADLIEVGPLTDPGFVSLWGHFLRNAQLVGQLVDIGEKRIHDMDISGVDKMVLSLTAPGVQCFDAATATSLAISTNDQLAAAVKKHPDRFAGLAAVAPQDPKAAAKEMERGIKKLGLNGVIINSHTNGEYLDDPKYWEIFEAAQALDAAIYLHPQTPPPNMVLPYLARGFERAIMGFAHETSLHVLGLMTSGVFDRFPKLKIVIGHGGEGLPYMLYRIDYMYENARYPFMKKVKKLPSDYMKENFYITTSGLPWAPAITMAQSVLGMDRVLYAMDYPYQFVPEEVTITDNFPISAADKKKLFQTNAERVFSL